MKYIDACKVVTQKQMDVLRSVEEFTWEFLEDHSRQLEWGWFIMVRLTFPDHTGRRASTSKYFVDEATHYCIGTLGCSEHSISKFLEARDKYATSPDETA